MVPCGKQLNIDVSLKIKKGMHGEFYTKEQRRKKLCEENEAFIPWEVVRRYVHTEVRKTEH